MAPRIDVCWNNSTVAMRAVEINEKGTRCLEV
jgi:hypothetical protein